MRDPRARWLAGLAMWFACTFTCVYLLYAAGSEGSWYPLHDAMQFDATPPFRHRVLFVLVARAIQFVRPALHDPRCYFVSQALAAGIAFWAMRRWAARFVLPPAGALSLPLLLMMLAPTFTYWTFYDIGIVASYTLGLWALVEKRYGLYLAVFAIATLNHENSVLLVPLALVLRYGTWRIGLRGVGWGALQLAIYAAARLALFGLMPVEAAWQSGKLAYNLHLVTHALGQLARAALLLAAWLAIVAVAWKRLPREIRWALLILGPELLVVTAVVGQLNELRQFNALIPVLVVATLVAFGARLRVPAGGESGAAAAFRGRMRGAHGVPEWRRRRFWHHAAPGHPPPPRHA